MSKGRHRTARVGLIGLGVVILLVAVSAAIFPVWWNHRSATASQALLREAGVTRPRSATTTAPQCVTATPTALGDQAPSGVLEIPSLGLTAPVVDGLGDSVLNVAVGHDPSSPWPGVVGESVLEAHDVSFFSHLDQISAGDEFTWSAGCSVSTFRVTGRSVMEPGQNVPTPPAGAGVALVTCWPTDALWWTPKRYVVLADLVSTTLVHHGTQWPVPVHAALGVPSTPGLTTTSLGLDTNSVALGTLRVAGTPSSTWASSPAPLDVTKTALEEYVAARRSVQDHNQQWWAGIALPGVPLPVAWSESGALDVTIDVTGSRVNTVTLAAGSGVVELSVSGPNLVVARTTGF